MVEIIAGAYQGRYIGTNAFILRPNIEFADVVSQRVVTVAPEYLGAPLNYQLPSAEGDAALPRYL